ncbi:MAG: secretin N-terminal domain-containing protein [bacterium]
MTKRQVSWGFGIVIFVILGLRAVQAEYRSIGLTPEAEFVTLSDVAAVPVSGGAEAVASAVGGMAADMTPSSTASPVAPSVPIVVEPVQTLTGAVTESVTGSATNTSIVTETVPVALFPSSDKQNLISVALDDVPLQDVVRLFTKISGANIIASSTNLQGKVTVNLQDVEWKPALDSILDMYSLMVLEKVPGSSIYSVTVKPPGAADPMVAQSIFLNYAQVSNVATIVTRMLVKDGIVSAFPNANALVIRSTAANLNEIRKVIGEIDLPRQQVYIEAKFLELTDEAIKDLGINWQVLEGYGVGVKTMSQSLTDSRSKFNGQRTGLGTVDSKERDTAASGKSTSPATGSGATDNRSSSDVLTGGNTLTLSDTIAKSANYSHESERIAGQSLSDVRTAVLSADDFRVVLSALQQINGISVVSNPKIIVANEETANIKIGNKEPNIKGTVTPGQQGQANTTTYALDDKLPYFQYGITVDVTPTINNQGIIRVNIVPTLSRFLDNKTAPDKNTYPITSEKTIKTSFSLESGKTAAIGGLTETEERDVVKKVPLLGDIPLIGKYLFTHTHKQRKQTETIIFVTVGLANPKTLQRDEGLPEDTSLTQKHMEAKRLAANPRGGKKTDEKGAKPVEPAKTP